MSTPRVLIAGAGIGGLTAAIALRARGIHVQLYEAASEPARGTGLGLSIVQGIARAHRGEIQAGNDPGGGAVFTIRIPAETGERPS